MNDLKNLKEKVRRNKVSCFGNTKDKKIEDEKTLHELRLVEIDGGDVELLAFRELTDDEVERVKNGQPFRVVTY